MLCRKGRIEIHFLSQDLRVTSSRPIVHGMLGEVVKSTEVQAIMGAFEHNKNNRLTAAHVLGFHKSILFREIKMVGIDLPDKKKQIHRKRNQYGRNNATSAIYLVAKKKPSL